MPSKLREFLNDVKTAIRKTNPDYDLVIERLYLYYNMQLVMFGIDKDKNLIIHIYNTYIISQYSIQPYTTIATDIISDRGSTSSNYRSEYTGTILHALTG